MQPKDDELVAGLSPKGLEFGDGLQVLGSASRSLEPDEAFEGDALARRTEQRDRQAVREQVLGRRR